MKFLHTSDWHLGRTLYGRKRYDEFSSFLNWLGDTIEEEEVDVLLVAGDVFDTSTPGNLSQELYYRFLIRVSLSNCRHIIVIAGNHDSPSFLNAPRELLKALNVYVVGSAAENLDDEIIVLKDEKKQPRAIICAVPYLRDRDIRNAEPGETFTDRNTNLISGMKNHYTGVCTIAEKKRAAFRKEGVSELPIIAMGHLFTAGGRTIDGDGVRELYVGSLAYVDQTAFPPSIDYLALGHLHVSQQVAGKEHLRYCGSPIPMGFGEAAREKKVVIINFKHLKNREREIREIPVPCFQTLEHITGTQNEILFKLAELKKQDSHAWLEIEYTGDEIIGNLQEEFEEVLDGSSMEILRIKNKRLAEKIISSFHQGETLDKLDEYEVFERCLDAFEVLPENRPELKNSYGEIIKALQEGDENEDS